MRLDPIVRRCYWRGVRAAESTGSTLPPHAFAADGGTAFAEWLREPVVSGSPVSRILFELWQQRPDLQAAFPAPFGADGDSLVGWARADPGFAQAVPPALVPPPAGSTQLPGVNLVGYLAGEFGVASAARMVLRMLRTAGIPVAAMPVSAASHRNSHRVSVSTFGAPYDVSILALNADGLLAYAQTPDFRAHSGRPRVGIWYWEVDVLPESMRPAFALVDEVWCASEHVRAALEPWTEKPVRKHPLVFEAPHQPTHMHRGDLGLPDDRFLFGFVFDYASVPARKNPLGLLETYRQAFGPDDGATLVLKSINARHAPAAAEAVRRLAGDRRDIILIDAHLDVVEMRALFELLDCYVSLHRSEGLGLTLSAAMAAGTPVIATGWSGNVEFMTADNSVLVPSSLEEVGPGSDPYPPEAVWASPDMDAAAKAMRRLFDRPDEARALGLAGRSTILREHAPELATPWLAERLTELTDRYVHA